MSTIEETKMKAKKLVDIKVNVKVKLALLWAALMFIYIYNDIFSMFQPGHVADLLNGHLEGMHFTQTILFSAAILMSLPSFMVMLSLMLKARVNRIVNIVVGILHILLLFGTQFVGEGETWLYWRINELLEVLFLLLIIWSAWKWPTIDSQQQ
jgi:hypothetical protein